jgi:F0F1-type ATP synthase gamma subunit
LIAEKYNEQYKKGSLTIWNIGKKGYEHFLKNRYKADATYKDIFLNLTFENVQLCSQAAMKAFGNKEFDAVELYTVNSGMRVHNVLFPKDFCRFQKQKRRQEPQKPILFLIRQKKN